MKLIYKTARYYLGYALFIFGLGTAIFYYVIKIILLDSIDEAIHQEKIQLIENLNYERVIDEIKPSENVDIKHSNLTHAIPDKYSIVEVFDTVQNQFVDYRQLNAVYQFDGKFYEIQIRQSMEEAEALLYGILPAEIGLFVLFLIGVLLMNNYVNKNVWKPFYDLLEKIKEYDFEKTKVIKYTESDITEFQELSVSIEKMTSKIYKDFINQKEFNENSSHEIQTPLAIIRNKLELIIQSPHLKKEEVDAIQSIFDAVRRLTTLNKGLLMISKIENLHYSAVEKINISDLVHKIVASLDYQIEENNLKLKVDIEKDVVLNVNQILIETLVINLLSNAIKHNLKDGNLNVYLSKHLLKIENTGLPLTVEAEELFERFKKNSDKEQSVGLGLSIVKRICRILNYSLSYKNIADNHIVKIGFNNY